MSSTSPLILSCAVLSEPKFTTVLGRSDAIKCLGQVVKEGSVFEFDLVKESLGLIVDWSLYYSLCDFCEQNEPHVDVAVYQPYRIVQLAVVYLFMIYSRLLRIPSGGSSNSPTLCRRRFLIVVFSLP